MKTGSLVVLDVVGLTPPLLRHMPGLSGLAKRGFSARLDPVLPAVTCSVQSSFLTGLTPARHGIVGNGWYFRDLGEVLFWRQHNALVRGEKVWETARRAVSGYRAANLGWWYAMGASTDVALTPRPIYHADGRKSPDCYTIPAHLHDELTRELGPFPLFRYWGPGAGIASSIWIAGAAKRVMSGSLPHLTLVYLPHLDYDLQRFGPESEQARAAAAEIDRVAGDLAERAIGLGAEVLVLSEYAITKVSRAVHLNRELRLAGLLAVYQQGGMEYLDPWASDAFAVADHQIAHLYVREPSLRARVKDLVEHLEGVDQVLDEAGKARSDLDHERSGELVAVAEPDAWFTYYYWLDDSHAPDFARTVEIHRKPGFDPCELFIDPDDRLAKMRAGCGLLRKRLGLRYVMDLVPLDPSHVKGSHGRLPDDSSTSPMLICSDPDAGAERFAATEIKGLLLGLTGAVIAAT
ncbi:MAG: alkaline phosphatase family protein [Actinomycetota bacterium]